MPVLLIDNPLRETSPNYDESSLVWQWRDMGTRVQHIGDLGDAVDHALKYPLDFSDQRSKYRTLLFGSLTDGRAGIRLAEQIDSLAAECVHHESVLPTSWPVLATRAFMRRMKRATHRKAAAL
jgi:hypothetical protein